MSRVLITGANGFIGAHVLKALQDAGHETVGTTSRAKGWRLEQLGLEATTTPTTEETLALLEAFRPNLVVHLAAHGAYSHEQDALKMWNVNTQLSRSLADWCEANNSALVMTGSSSEYGANCSGPSEVDLPRPNSTYALTKLAATQWITHRVIDGELRGVVLRLYSVYGPLEEPTRLMPSLVRSAVAGRWIDFAERRTSRDFVFIDDAVDAILKASARLLVDRSLPPVLNIASGVSTSMEDLAGIAARVFSLEGTPRFGDFTRAWDLSEWFGDPRLAQQALGWKVKTSLADGLARMSTSPECMTSVRPTQLAQPPQPTPKRIPPDISFVVACYRDAEAIPIMAKRVQSVVARLGVTHELIFVNDASPDDTRATIERLSADDHTITGITHARNFGSQAAFLSGMKHATGDWVVLLDGDLQDPPELVADFWEIKDQGFDVVYGRRVDREATWIMRKAYKAFYRTFNRVAPFPVPKDAGDFSLMSRRVVNSIASMPEQDLFIRAQRAYAGFRQVGVDYVRPERMFGKSTNNLGRNLGWATRGVLAVSRAPLTALSFVALAVFGIAVVTILVQLLLKVLAPESAPPGLVSISVLVIGVGSLNLLFVAVVGEYVGRILEETKRRPRYIGCEVTRLGSTVPIEWIDERKDT